VARRAASALGRQPTGSAGMDQHEGIRMNEEAKVTSQAKEKSIDLGRCGSVTLYLSGDRRRLLVAFDVDERGFDKSGLNGFIEALKKVRDKMER
jgi:hypothetical protein